ncbi:MAG: NAD-dependent epimerase/dehydratase family protein [Nitrospiraceae bacterium]|nr:NAD-dependent epimerase/dehydratase family protein [Nitrospiraceae bacterium]
MTMPDTHAPVLVTGGTGFVGSHLVELLLKGGYPVTCLVRHPRRLRWLAGLPVRIVQGDCTDARSLDSAVQEAAIVIHAAGVTKAIRIRDYYEVNQQGTKNLLEACARSGKNLRRLVLVSSLAAAGPAKGLSGVTAGDDPRPLTDYGRSKLFAEQEALRYRDRFPVVILRPSAVYGPRDTDVFEIFRWAARGFLPKIGREESWVSWCYVADLAEVLVRAAERPVASGSIYHVAGDRPYSQAEFRDLLARSGTVKTRTITVPSSLAYLMACFTELAGRISSRPTILNRQKVREATQRYWTCDLAALQKDFGPFLPVPLEQGLSMTWSWYRAQGWLSQDG